MAPKRAAPRTESVAKQSKGSFSRQRRSSGQVGPSSRLTQISDQLTRRRNTQPPPTIDLTTSDLSSEVSQIDTPRSLDRTSSAASLTEIVPPKRRRLQTEVDYSHQQNSIGRGVRTDCIIGSAHPQSNIEAGSSSSNRRKTGSCNSKRLRGKGHVGGSSSDNIFVTDSNQPTTDDSHYLPPTAHSNLVTMPANLEDIPSTSKVSNRVGGSRTQESSGTNFETSGSGSTNAGHWFRSFTCFANSADDEQTALDLSVESTRSGNVQSGIGSNQPSTDTTVFSNPAQPELPAEGSNVSESIARIVTSLSYSAAAASALQNPSSSSSSSSRNLRNQRGGGTTSTNIRQESSGTRRGNQGSRHGSSRNAPPSNNPGVHIHGASSSSQSQSHHHSVQGSGINYRIMQLKNLRGDISAQMSLLQEINQSLLMGSDDSLAGLAVQELVSGVVDLLSAENVLSCLPEEEMIEIKNLCCNILAHLMDVIPKAADTVVMAVPLLINIMSCSFVGDILERIINVLEQVSRRNGRDVLHCGAVPRVMGFYDFVTVAQHRVILSMVANCFANVRKEDFESYVAGSLQSLCERLSPIASTEPRCLERVCLCFARLVHAFKSEPEKLRYIASFSLCEHLRHLLEVSPPIVTNMRDIANMLATLCTHCPDLAVDVLKMGYAETVYNLLTDQKPPELSLQLPTAKSNGSTKGPRSTSLRNSIARTLESRGADNVSAIINLIRAMLPPIQESGLLLAPPINPASQRGAKSSAPSNSSDVQKALFKEQCVKFENLVSNCKFKSGEEKLGEDQASENLVVVKAVHLLLPMLLDLYTELNGTSSRLKCIEAVQRIVCSVSPFVLTWVISPRAVSSLVSDMLGNPEFSLIAAGIQLVNIFVTRVPNVFAVYFRKEGVLFHLKRLTTLAENEEEDRISTTSVRTAAQQQVDTPAPIAGDAHETAPYHLRSLDYIEPMVTETETARISSRRRRHATRSPHFIEMINRDFPEHSPSESYEASETSSGHSTLDMELSVDASPTIAGQSSGSVMADDTGYHDSNLRAWIKTQCQELYDRIQTLVACTSKPETLVSKAAASGKKSARRHHLASSQGVSTPPRDLVPELEALSLQLRKADDPATWIEGLNNLANLLIQQMKSASDDEAPSPFEIQHSGMLNALQTFLTSYPERRLRLFLFLRVFVGPRYTDNIDLAKIVESPKMLSLTKNALLSLKQKPDVYELAFSMLINSLLDCLHQQEHFQVLVNPTSQSRADVYAEELAMAIRQTAPSLSTPHSQRRSGGRRSNADAVEEESNPRTVIQRRLAGMSPGFVKLEIVRQSDEATTAASTSKKPSTDSPSSIWERASPSTSLHVTSLLTAQRLRNQLIQRVMINSVMQSPEGGLPRELLLDSEEGLFSSLPIPSAFTHRRRGTAGGGGRRNAQDTSSNRGSIRPDILSMEREFINARSIDNSHARSMSLLAAFGMLQFPGSTGGAGNLPSTTESPISQQPIITQQHSVVPSVPRPGNTPPPTHSSTAHNRSATGSASAQAPPTSSRHHTAASSSASVTAGSSSAHHSTRYQTQQQQQQQQQQTQSGHRSSHHHPSMIFSGSSSAAAEFVESVSGSGAPVPVFYIGGIRIPERMSLYQALRTYSPEVKERARQLLAEHRFSMTEQNREDRINAFIWRNVHTIHYRLEKPNTTSNDVDATKEFQLSTSSTSPVPSTSSGAVIKHSPSSSLSAAISCLKRSRRSEDPSRASSPPNVPKPIVERLFTFLENLTEWSALNKGHMAANLGLLRILYGLSEFGNTLDDLIEPYPIVSADHFQSQKLSAKASRQLQDVFYVVAGHFPRWLVEIISTCPFLFPFSVRQNFLYVYNFDRERAILHLQDSTNASAEGEGGGSIDSSRIGSARRDRGSRSSFVQRISSHFGRHGLAAVRYGGFDGGAAILENLLAEPSNQLNKHKIVVSRDPKRLLRAAETAMNELRDSRSGLEIAFEGEVGFGLGPTLEFYTLVSHQLMTASLNLWHGDNYTNDGYIIAPAPGLYPRPLPKNTRSAQSKEIRAKFYFLGQLMARALLDWRQLDLSLSPVLFKWFLYVQNPEEDIVLSGPRVGVTPADLALVDPTFAKHFHSLLKLARRRQELVDESVANKAVASAIEEEIQAIDNEVDDLCLTFVLPGYQIDLCRNGNQMSVTGSLLSQYLHLVANWYLVEGVRRQVTALIAGFDSVLPGVRTGKLATLFRPDECEGLFCGSGSLGGLYRDQLALLRTGGISHVVSVIPSFISTKNSGASTSAAAAGWDVDTLMKSCLCDHGYTHQSTAIQYLFEIMSEFNETQRRLFIQFTTGSPRLPIGGFRALKPPLKIVMKREAEEHADQHLPSVMTCQNYLKLPNYSSKKIMLEKLLYAIHEGQHAFHLS